MFSRFCSESDEGTFHSLSWSERLFLPSLVSGCLFLRLTIPRKKREGKKRTSIQIYITLLNLLCGVGSLALTLLTALGIYTVEELIRPNAEKPRTGIPPRRWQLPVEEVVFPSLQGPRKINGWFLPALNPRGLVILSAGYRTHRSMFTRTMKDLWQQGYSVLAFAFYGHDEIKVPLTHGQKEIHDLLGALAYARWREPNLDISLLGYSMGGAISLMVAEKDQQIQAVICDSAFASSWSSVEYVIHQRLPMALPRWLRHGWYFCADLWLYVRTGHRFQEITPVDLIHRVQCPVLLIHGTGDRVVRYHDAVALKRAATNQVELWSVEGAAHLTAYRDRAYASRLITFLDEAYGADIETYQRKVGM